MKLLILFLGLGLLHVSATTYGQQVTLIAKDTPLETVIRQLRMQTGYDFVADRQLVRRAGLVSVQLRETTLEDALKACLQGKAIDFHIQNGIVSLVPNTTPSPSLVQAFQQTTGRVVDSVGNPLVGASIRVLNADGQRTALQTQTDRNGEFMLRNVPSDARLEISYIGYITQEISATTNLSTIVLREAPSALGEVVVNAGYYTVKEKERTGSISRITAQDIETQPVTNVLGAAIGRMPGVQITQNTGVPGGGFTVRIRGQNSIASGNNPLYIIDGVPFVSESLALMGADIISQSNPLTALSPSDITSIEVLKDADATAIYGSRGANGVVLITTKTGQSGKTAVDLNLQGGIGRVSNRVNLLNTPQYLEMRREAFANDDVTPNEINAPDLLSWDQNRNIDWQERLIGATSFTNNSNMAVSGGSEQTHFSVRGNYYHETTVFPGDHGYKRWSLNTNLNHRSRNDRFRFNVTTIYTKDHNNLFGTDLTSSAMLLPPNAPDFFDDEGNLLFYNNVSNPYVYTLQRFETQSKNFVSNGVMEYELFPGLHVKANTGYTQLSRNEVQLRPGSSLNPASTSLPTSAFGNTSFESWVVEPQLQYQNDFGKSRLQILVGASFQENIKEQTLLEATGFTSDLVMENPAAASQLATKSYGYSQYKYQAFFGRMNYSMDSKYIFNFTGRRDGSSRFGSGKQFANFAAVGAAWVFSKESFINRSLSFLSFGKLRASYGVTGNDQIGDYEYLDTYSNNSYPYLGRVGLYPTRLSNPIFSWERNRKLETALDLWFLNDRIMIGLAYYRNRSDNQLVGLPLPSSTGFTSIRANLPALVENTGWEIDLTVINFQKKEFSWKTNFNVSIPDNKLLEYPGLESSVFANAYDIGKSLFIKKKLHLIGVNDETGVYEFEDINNDGRVSSPDDLRSLYETTQQYFGGLQNSLTYKNWQLDVFFQFVKQRGIRYTHYNAPGYLYNQPSYVMDRWREPGDISDIQKFTQRFSDAGSAYSTAQVQSDFVYGNTSFIRFKNVSLSYQVPLGHSHLKNARVYVQGQNIFTVTNYKGLNPESPGRFLPPLQTFALGVQLTL